jgi:hypothetical protein
MVKLDPDDPFGWLQVLAYLQKLTAAEMNPKRNPHCAPLTKEQQTNERRRKETRNR